VRAQVLVHRHADDRHAARSQVPHQRNKRQGTRRVRLIRVDDVHVCAQEDGDNAETDQDGSHDWTPDGDRGEIRPAHPEETDGDRWGAVHCEEKAGLAVYVQPLTVVAVAGELLLCLMVDDRDEEKVERDADEQADENDVGEPGVDAVSFLEDVRVAV